MSSNHSNYTVVSGTSDADTIYNYGSHVTVQGNSGNDYLVSFGEFIVGNTYEGDVKIYGGYGSDSIAAYGESLIAYGGVGADSIYTSGDDSTVVGGTGNDTIYIGGVPERLTIKYDLGDGNDVVQDFSYAKNSKLSISGTSYYGRHDSGSDAIITVGSSGSSSITFKGMAGKAITINGSSYSDGDSHIVSTPSSSSVATTSSSSVDNSYVDYDSKNIRDSSNNTVITGSSSADTIKTFGDTVTIDGGYGDDLITFYSSNSSVYGGNGMGNDTINATSFGDYATIKGGWGNDYISLSSYANNVLIQHSYLDDYDTITGFDSNDSIEVTSGTYSTVNSGNDLLVKIDPVYSSTYDGSILLLGMAGKSVNIIGTPTGSSSTSTATNDADTIVTQTSEYTDMVLDGGVHARVYPNGKMINLDTGVTMYDPEAAVVAVTAIGGGSGDTIINITNNYITNVNNTYTYKGGDQIINNYVSNEIVDITNISYVGIDLEQNTFYVNSADGGRLGIENARDKFIHYNSGSNNFTDYSYVASGAGAINATGLNGTAMMIGAANSDNQISAGAGGSSMWGGMGGNDVMTGSAGYDEYFYFGGCGNDNIMNCGSNDLVNLSAVSVSQVSAISMENKTFNIQFTDGGSLHVASESESRYLIEGYTLVMDHNTGTFR
ncbi:MAG: hypothetical protein IJU91_08495 [Selenomonadaceae bacterium]|nr:hypothetical protein [Selenomonadaceae bacterium]